MRHKLSTEAGMKSFLEKYNYFHDALLASVKFSSEDYFFDKPPKLEITGQFSAVLSIDHYNYSENTSQKTFRISVELGELGALSFNSVDAKEPFRHWAITKIEITQMKHAPGRWLMTIISQKIGTVSAVREWVKTNLAQIEFGSLVWRKMANVR